MAENKQESALGKRARLRAGLEEALKAWFKNGGTPGEIPGGTYTVDGVECIPKHCTSLGNGFSYVFIFEKAQAIPVFIRSPRKKPTRDSVSPPTDGE